MQAKISRKLEVFIENLPRTPRPYFSFNPALPPTFTHTQPPSIRVNSSTHFPSVDHVCVVQWPSTLRSGVTLRTHFSFVLRIEERKHETFSFVSSKTNYSGNDSLISILRFVCDFTNIMHLFTPWNIDHSQ